VEEPKLLAGGEEKDVAGVVLDDWAVAGVLVGVATEVGAGTEEALAVTVSTTVTGASDDAEAVTVW